MSQCEEAGDFATEDVVGALQRHIVELKGGLRDIWLSLPVEFMGMGLDEMEVRRLKDRIARLLRTEPARSPSTPINPSVDL